MTPDGGTWGKTGRPEEKKAGIDDVINMRCNVRDDTYGMGWDEHLFERKRESVRERERHRQQTSKCVVVRCEMLTKR